MPVNKFLLEDDVELWIFIIEEVIQVLKFQVSDLNETVK
jgi:hypothetical protein